MKMREAKLTYYSVWCDALKGDKKESFEFIFGKGRTLCLPGSFIYRNNKIDDLKFIDENFNEYFVKIATKEQSPVNFQSKRDRCLKRITISALNFDLVDNG